MTPLRQLLLLPFAFGQPLAESACSVDNISNFDIPGIDILQVKTEEVRDYAITTVQIGDIEPANLSSLNFCSANITYTHPGKDDRIVVQIWLPLEDNWNGRFQGTGGGGFATGFGSLALAPAVNDGYSAACTDGGHASTNTEDWALIEPGKVDLTLLEDFASIALNDMALLGKAVTEQYYGKAPNYSYWSGCSTGVSILLSKTLVMHETLS